MTYCHCNQCRKVHGAAFASSGSVPRSDLLILRGANSIRAYASSPTAVREFCMECSSTLFWSRLIPRSCRRSRDMRTSTPLRPGIRQSAFGLRSAYHYWSIAVSLIWLFSTQGCQRGQR
ncbi:GFA family protein [Pseudomonas sp. KCA11]|nr:GFA family protein [Pseudomonas sp. KCA11]